MLPLFQLIAAMNPCPCGYALESDGRCRCTPDQVRRYQGKLSGPLLDRIDIHIQVNPIPAAQFLAAIEQREQESSAQVAKRVAQSVERQLQRQQCRNALLQGEALKRHCALTVELQQLLAKAATKMQFSARACTRILKVSRSIADLDSSTAIERKHLLEALSYRQMTAPAAAY